VVFEHLRLIFAPQQVLKSGGGIGGDTYIAQNMLENTANGRNQPNRYHRLLRFVQFVPRDFFYRAIS
jgi:hypothetical protein